VEDLDVAALVDDLGAAEQLAVEPGHGLGHLAGGEERALLAVQELAEHPGQERMPLHVLLALAQLVPRGDVGHRQEAVGEQRALRVVRVDVDLPVEVGGRIPLRALGGLVEAAHLWEGALVRPVEVGMVAERHPRGGGGLAALFDESAEGGPEQGPEHGQVRLDDRVAQRGRGVGQVLERATELHAGRTSRRSGTGARPASV
jgi:hypothetical protein